MNNWLRQYGGLTLGLTFTAFVIISLVFLWVRDVAPVQAAAWEQNPVVVLCPDDKLTVEAVSDALDFWEAVGHPISEIKISDEFMCPAPAPGQITVRSTRSIPQNSNHVLGQTTLTYQGDNIVSAEVDILQWPWFTDQPLPRDAYNRILRHELGHAFGYMHLNQIGHVMAPSVDRMGTDTEGIPVEPSI